jgi:hypothetical protein
MITVQGGEVTASMSLAVLVASTEHGLFPPHSDVRDPCLVQRATRNVLYLIQMSMYPVMDSV